jgi:C4-dicarboxylate transporter, DctM subunit
VIIIYLLLGCFMDQIAILLLTLPLTFPLVVSLGYDPIWYGIIITALVEIGLITPPLGMNVYVVGAASKVPLEVVFKGACIMLLFEGVAFSLLLWFPIISTYLPSLMR